MSLPRAINLLREATHYRRECFDAGLQAAGFDVVRHIDRPTSGDVLVIWNRYGAFDDVARQFEARGAQVLVVENGPLGKTWRGGEWFSLALGAVALTGGEFQARGSGRWDSWQVDLAEFRVGRPHDPLVILAQRGIGSSDVRSPDGWAEKVQRATGGRIRQHPGRDKAVKPLAEDLNDAGTVATWSSAAAVQSLELGVPVWHDHPAFVMAGACRPLQMRGKVSPLMDDEARLAAFRRLAWCMWTLDEIKSGEPIRCLLSR